MPELRADLTPMPVSMRQLPVDRVRNIPIPFFVSSKNGVPDFRAMDPAAINACVGKRRCWVCGSPLLIVPSLMTFVGGPMCGLNGITAEPPSHLACARWSAANCPFLNGKQAERRGDDLSTNVGGDMLTSNPGVTMLLTCRKYQLEGDGKGGRLFHVGEPVAVEWWTKGRKAKRVEVVAAVERSITQVKAKPLPAGMPLEEFERLLAQSVDKFFNELLPAA